MSFGNNVYVLLSIPAAALFACSAGGEANAGEKVVAVAVAPDHQEYRVVASYPHDPLAWTQGLFFHNGAMYECTGQEGKSYVREVDFTTGTVKREIKIADDLFGEGCVIAQNQLFQLTWQNKKGFIYNPTNFAKVGEWPYSHEGWGLTFDGTHLILSDGSATLRFMNPRNPLVVVKTLEVKYKGAATDSLNELEMVKGELWANIWTQDSIARIDPATGNINGWIVLKGLLPDSERNRYQGVDVLNGIAYDPQSDRLFVTGKHWPKLYEIKLVPPE